MVESVNATKKAKYLHEDHAPRMRLAFETRRVLKAVPSGCGDVVYEDTNSLLSYVFQFGTVQGLMPVHEVGIPVWPETISAASAMDAQETLWSFLAMDKKDRGKAARRMINIMNAAHPLPFIVTAINGNTAALSRVAALKKIKPSVKKGQLIDVVVLGLSGEGAICDWLGASVFIPKEEVFYGTTPSYELFSIGECYVAKVISVKSGLITASTKAVSPDPWESFTAKVGSVRMARILSKVDGPGNLYRIEFERGITGLAEASPLVTYLKDQTVAVRIRRMLVDQRQIRGFIDS